ALSHYRLATVSLRLGLSASGSVSTSWAIAYRWHALRALHFSQIVAKPDPENAQARIDLMLVQARSGLANEAAANARQLRARFPEDPRILFNEACCYALCSTVEWVPRQAFSH